MRILALAVSVGTLAVGVPSGALASANALPIRGAFLTSVHVLSAAHTDYSARARAKSPNAARSVTYPYAATDPAKTDPWGAEVRQCTSFASWWLSTHGVAISRRAGIQGPRGHATLGNAAQWEKAARKAGFPVTNRPVVGAIAQWRANERSGWHAPSGYSYIQAGSSGHVAVVRKVYPDGTALLQDFNGVVPLGMHTVRGRAPRYLLMFALPKL